MKVSEHFDLRELINDDIYNHPAIGDRAADFINANTAPSLEDMRSDFGPITINDWHTGGAYKNSGLRAPNSPVGAALSAHRFGTAFDLKFLEHKPISVYFKILNNQDRYPFITRMENAERTVTWLHIEFSTAKRPGEIIIFNP